MTMVLGFKLKPCLMTTVTIITNHGFNFKPIPIIGDYGFDDLNKRLVWTLF